MSIILLLANLGPSAAANEDESYAKAQSPAPAYVFAWPSRTSVSLRGGTTKGPPITLREEPSEAWTALQEASLSAQERDRRAILALAGDYRASFDFIETEVFAGEPAEPYRSWGTERVHVLVDEPGRIVLQHIMTMYVVDDEGEVSDPIVVKHWRQDWKWEPTTMLAYQGMGHFEVEGLSEDQRSGRWSQTVYQVDDTPRYAMIGAWNHSASFSEWVTDPAWRPLPRRERTARDDYQALGGWNRLTVHPTGWVHFQDNVKTVLDDPGVVNAETPVLARELGVIRYDRVLDFDFAPGDEYWAATQDYWAMVRDTWDARVSVAGSFVAKRVCEDKAAYERFFALAEPLTEGKRLRVKSTQRKIDEIVACIAQ